MGMEEEEVEEDEAVYAEDEGVEEEEEEDEDEPEAAEEAAEEPEEEYVLQPAAAAEGAATPAPLEGDLDEAMVHAAGKLILEQNRVAVSLLQRHFELEFDQACTVLDHLQERGLIGPYVGGRTREILLTAEEWMAAAPQA